MEVLILDLNVLDKKHYDGVRSYEQEDVVKQSASSRLFNQVMTDDTLDSVMTKIKQNDYFVDDEES